MERVRVLPAGSQQPTLTFVTTSHTRNGSKTNLLIWISGLWLFLYHIRVSTGLRTFNLQYWKRQNHLWWFCRQKNHLTTTGRFYPQRSWQPKWFPKDCPDLTLWFLFFTGICNFLQNLSYDYSIIWGNQAIHNPIEQQPLQLIIPLLPKYVERQVAKLLSMGF